MKLFSLSNIYSRINILVVILLFIVFSLLGTFLYLKQRNKIVRKTDQQMNIYLEDLVNILQIQRNGKQEKVNTSLDAAHYIFHNSGKITESDTSYIEMEAINQITKEQIPVKVRQWWYDSTMIHQSNEIVDKIQKVTKETATIFQKIPYGYLRISTNVLKTDGSRAIGTFIPNSSPVVRTIERGETYRGRAFVVNDWYLTAYEPIYIEGEIKGMLYVGTKEKEYATLKPIFAGKQYLESGYPYLLNKKGILIIHPTHEGEDISDKIIFQKLNKTKKRQEKLAYYWPENENGRAKYQYSYYFEPYEAFVCVSIYKDEVFQELSGIRLSIIIGMLLAMILTTFGISLIIKPLTHSIEKISQRLFLMAEGEKADKFIYKRKDEIGKIAASMNSLIDALNQTARFAIDIGHGKLDTQYKPRGENDRVGKALVEMRQSLINAKDEAERRAIEDDRRSWITQGRAKFAETLRQTSGLQQLADKVVETIIEYLKVDICALFVINDKAKDDIHLELMASYAYDRRKFVKKRVELREGLVGMSAVEKITRYLTEIPENYIDISSGLGDTEPACLLIIPLQNEEENVLGVIEIAAMKPLEDYKVQFMKDVSITIASTITTIKINERTAELLQRSRKQSQEMATQEEEMRQNLEELRATQDEMQRQRKELETANQNMKKREEELLKRIEMLEDKLKRSQ